MNEHTVIFKNGTRRTINKPLIEKSEKDGKNRYNYCINCGSDLIERRYFQECLKCYLLKKSKFINLE